LSFVSYPPEPSDWGASIRARMFDQRVVFITGAVTDELAGRAAMELMTLDASGDSAVQLHIDSANGDLGAALGVMDVVDTMGVDVTAVAMGVVGGPAVGILAVCAKRVSMPSARFHLCEPHASFSGDARTIERWLDHRRRQWATYCERVAAALGQPAERVEALFDDGRYLGAADAVAMGLVQEVAKPQGDIRPIRPGYGA
jgi:ATP-dependent Clp protease protease subunit